MISKLAEEVHAGWMRERLQPTLRMCVDLNAAGLAVERGPMASGFYSVPRVAYLGDFVFREPTVRRLAYMEDLRALLDGDEETQFLAAAYALHVPEADLVPLDSRRRARKAVSRFAVEVLADFSLSQAVSRVLVAWQDSFAAFALAFGGIDGLTPCGFRLGGGDVGLDRSLLTWTYSQSLTINCIIKKGTDA